MLSHRLLLAGILLPLALAKPIHSMPTYQCVDFNVPMSFEGTALITAFPPFQQQEDSVQFLAGATQWNSAAGPSPLKGIDNKTQVDVTVYAKYCTPSNGTNGIVQILSHGLGFDHTYWTFGAGFDEEYDYVKAATDAGYSTLLYDRIGTGKSTKTDPYTISNQATQLGVLKILTDELRNGTLPAPPGKIPIPQKIVHVGHSFGSLLSDALATHYPDDSDGLVLTGFSTNLSLALPFFIGSNFHIAAQTNPRRFRDLSTGYLTWRDQLANQYAFLHWPNFSPAVLAASEKVKQPFALGEFLTTAVSNATQFTKPVIIVTGEYDRVFCGGYCGDILDTAKAAFPLASPFETYVQPDTGHGINLHFNASGAYSVITEFVNKNIKA